MPFNLLLFPLLGGYIFALQFYKTRFHVLRADKERLLILSSCVAVALVTVVWTIHAFAAFLLPCAQDGFCIPKYWNDVVGIEYSGISFASMILGFVAWYPLNHLLCRDREKEIDAVLRKDCDAFELLVRKCAKENLMVAVSMKNGKVYIGWIDHEVNPATPTKFISLIPLESGYRLADTKRLILTVDYAAALEAISHRRQEKIKRYRELANPTRQEMENLLLELESLSVESSKFSIVLPVSELVSINQFDRAVHQDYFANATPQMTP